MKRKNSKIQCLFCDKILESTHRHDFVSCGCENGTFVDGGSDYLRMGGKDLDLIRILDDPSSQESS